MSEDGFTPVRPPRAASVTPAWRSLFNEHSRNAVAGWSELAFREWHTRRNVLGTIVHIPRHPDAIERVLLSNAANYEKPRIVKRVIAPLIGRGLVSSDGELWRTQRRIVALFDRRVEGVPVEVEDAADGHGENKAFIARPHRRCGPV